MFGAQCDGFHGAKPPATPLDVPNGGKHSAFLGLLSTNLWPVHAFPEKFLFVTRRVMRGVCVWGGGGHVSSP